MSKFSPPVSPPDAIPGISGSARGPVAPVSLVSPQVAPPQDKTLGFDTAISAPAARAEASDRPAQNRRLWVAAGITVPFATAAAALIAGAPEVALLAGLGGCIASAPTLRRRALPKSTAVAEPATRDAIVAALDTALKARGGTGSSIGAFVIELDNYKQIEERKSHDERAALLQVCGQRLACALGEGDLAGRVEGPCFVVSHCSSADLDLEQAIRFATGLQALLNAPISLPSGNVYPSVCVGFALSERFTAPTGDLLLQSAMSAMIEAQRSGTGAIRSFSTAMRDRIAGRARLVNDVRQALCNGQIKPFFQPQIATDGDRLTGFETLARWHHPERGMIPPSEFLPAIEEAGLMERLGELMTREALSAMRKWENAGLYVPQVGVNFSTFELSNPGLADQIVRALQDFALTPDRLTIEVLETVVAGQHDHFVAQNLSRLAEMGCRLDLDDFGTGHASITSIRRFSIARIKIDRTFVTRIDEDDEQQDMVAAILTMAERLGLEALAEGVETAAELAKLRQLGCAYVQGFGIARPMPLSETFEWIEDYICRAAEPLTLHARSA